LFKLTLGITDFSVLLNVQNEDGLKSDGNKMDKVLLIRLLQDIISHQYKTV